MTHSNFTWCEIFFEQQKNLDICRMDNINLVNLQILQQSTVGVKV